MIFWTFAAAALVQWTGPRTVEYVGPGYFCGGGYAVQLTKGERALILPQGQAPQATRLVLFGGEVNIVTGARPDAGPVVKTYGGTAVIQQNIGEGVAYTVADQTSFALRVTSSAFHGFKSDRWFFTKVDFTDGADRAVPCIAAYSY
jgi:hypothetical protein